MGQLEVAMLRPQMLGGQAGGSWLGRQISDVARRSSIRRSRTSIADGGTVAYEILGEWVAVGGDGHPAFSFESPT